MCGSTDLIKQNGVFVCQTCGCKYSVEEAHKMMIEGVVDVSGSIIKIDNAAQVQKSLDNARRARVKEDWLEAEKYYNLVEREEPQNLEAIFFSAYSKAMQTLIDKNIFVRQDAFKVFINCFSLILEHWDSKQEEENQQIFTDITAALCKMLTSSFVYTQTTTAHTVSDNTVQTYDLFSKVVLSFQATVEQLSQIDDHEYLHEQLIEVYKTAKAHRAFRNDLLDLWIRGEQKASKRAYYRSNPEAYEKLIAEQEDLKTKLETVESIYTHRNKEFLDKERQLRIQASNLGFFKAKERKALEEQIESVINDRTKLTKAYRLRKEELNKQLENLGCEFPKKQEKLKTAQEMDFCVNRKWYYYDTAGGNYQKYFRAIEEALEPDEYVLMPIMSNSFHRESRILIGGNTAIAFTNRRLLVAQKKIEQIFDLQCISYVEQGAKGITGGDIWVYVNQNQYRFTVDRGSLKKTYDDLFATLDSFEYGLCCWSAMVWRNSGRSLLR